MNKHQSYTAADTLPAKLLQSESLMHAVRAGRIPPVHPQLIVTNRCNLKCGFCSCANRDKGEELPYFAVVKTLNNLAHLGAQAVTITGGGEPMLHPRINEIIQHAAACGLKVGLVTNGVALSRLNPEAARCITWLRVSASDEADNLHHWRTLPALFPTIDWAISYVVTAALDPRNIAAHVAFANECDMTHVRLVADLIDLAGVQGCMDRIRAGLATAGVPDARVIYQARQGHEPGARRCWISLLKPVIGADGRVYPCCGVQYAQDSMALDLPANMSMGGIDALRSIWTTDTPPVPFNGAQCVRCYYGGYNAVMEAAQGTGQHAEFVCSVSRRLHRPGRDPNTQQARGAGAHAGVRAPPPARRGVYRGPRARPAAAHHQRALRHDDRRYRDLGGRLVRVDSGRDRHLLRLHGGAVPGP